MVTAATCKGAVGAVSHPHALIPKILPGWGSTTSACRFVLLVLQSALHRAGRNQRGRRSGENR